MRLPKLFPTLAVTVSVMCSFQSAQADFLGGLSKKLSEASDVIAESGNKVVDGIKDVGQDIGVIEKDKPADNTKQFSGQPKKESTAVAESSPPAGAEPLPGGVSSRIQKMYRELDKVDKKMATGAGSATDRAQRAQTDLKRAHSFMDEIDKRYSGRFSPNHPDMVAAKSRLAEAQKAFDRALAGAIEHDTAIAAEEHKQEEAAAAELARIEEERKIAEAAEKVERADAEAFCRNWDDKLSPYAYGDKTIGSSMTTNQQAVAGWRRNAGEATQLLAEYPRGKCASVDPIADLVQRRIAEFSVVEQNMRAQQQQLAADKGTIVFSTSPFDDSSNSSGQQSFQAGDNIYGIIRITRPWSEIYKKDRNLDVRINTKIDGKSIHAQFVKIKDPSLSKEKHLIFNVAPDPRNLVAYSDPRIEYGKATASIVQGPNELTHHLAKLSPGTHILSFDVYYYGKIWAAGEFTISGDNYSAYEKLHNTIAGGVIADRTLPKAQMNNKGLEQEMISLLKEAGWDNVYRLNIIDKDWWIERINGGNTPVKAKYLAAVALTKKSDGTCVYKKCTFHKDRLITGGFSELYLSHQGDEVTILAGNIDK